MTLMTRALWCGLIGGAAIATLPASQLDSVERGDWPSYGGTSWSQKYSPLDRINRDTFNTLAVAWTWRSPDHEIVGRLGRTINPPLQANGMKGTPLVVNGTMFMSTGLGQIAAIDPVSGVTKWVYDPESYKDGGSASVVGPWQTRGVAYWTDGKTDHRILMGTSHGYLLALNAATGQPVRRFGDNGKVDLYPAIPRARRNAIKMWSGEGHYVSPNSPPLVLRDTVIVGSAMSDRPPLKSWPPGHVQAFDVRTGRLRWVFHVIPEDGEYGAATWKEGSNRYTGNANVWTMISGDAELGHVYLPTSTPTSDYWGGFRKGDNLFADSLVAVDVDTGKRVWHFQTVHHSVWDYDLPAAPNVVDLTVRGARVKAIAQVSKQGFTYVFNRVSGTPLWPIEERAVPPSDVPGEELSPTQPFPTRPAPFEYQGVSDDLLIDFTPALRAEAREIVRRYRHGTLYTPQSLWKDGGTMGTLQLPGISGGANWGGAGVDPESGYLYVPSRSGLTMMALSPGSPSFTDFPYVPNGKLGPESVHPERLPLVPAGPQGLPLIKPPYSRMTAVDLNTGEIAWQVPTGPGPDGVRGHPALTGLSLPALGGQGGAGGPLVTKTLLIYALIPTSGRGEKGRLVAYDKRTGAVLADVEIPGVPLGTPMTYLTNGKQFIALTTTDGRLIALTVRGN